MRENLFLLVSHGLLEIFGVPWLVAQNFDLHMVFSPGACLYPNFSFDKDTQSDWITDYPNAFTSGTSVKILSLNKITFQGIGG